MEHVEICIGVVIALILIVLTSIILFFCKRIRIGKPTNLKVSDVEHDSVTLEWTKPKQGGKHITSYTILCRSSEDPSDQWKSKTITSKEKARVTNLRHHTSYFFKVRPKCCIAYGEESDVTDEIKTKPKYPGKPSCGPMAIRVTQNGVCLKWGEPEFGADQVIRSSIFYQSTEGNQNQWEKVVVQGKFCIKVVNRLKPETKYIFKVCPESKFGIGPESDLSNEIKTEKVLSKRIKEDSQIISPADTSSPELYNLGMKKCAEGMRYILGEPSSNQVDEKVMMLVGATGAGKTTLLNGIVNYILGVQLEDDFRFQLDLKTDVSQAHSQTSKVTAYTFYPMDGSRLPYPLTIIDTPGFGDTRGITFDKKINQQILDAASIGEHSIKHLNGVGVVIRASSTRLTPTQNFIFDSILKVFGNDVTSNIFLMMTFADSQDPPAISAVKKANVPYRSFFKFNNSALFANPLTNREFTQPFWNLGMESFDSFFAVFGDIKPVSMQQTKEVLIERQHLELLIEGLQQKINSGLDKINTLHREEKLLKKKEEQMKINENFAYEVTVTKPKRVDISQERDQRALNCRNCLTTCHFPCEITGGSTYDCVVMNSHDPNIAQCTICPSTCTWNTHELQCFHYESIKSVEIRTIKKLKARYDEAKDHHEKAKSAIAKLEDELSQMQQDVMIKIKHARKCKERLNEIALKPGTLTETDYIDILILTEKEEAAEGFMKRIEALEELKKASELLAQLDEEASMPPKEYMKDWWTSFRSENCQKLYCDPCYYNY